MTGGTLAFIRKTVEGGNIKAFNITECPHAMEWRTYLMTHSKGWRFCSVIPPLSV
jgi:hypothetical protein